MPSSIYVMPRSPSNWGGAAALWVTVAGWAGAGRRAGLDPLIVTPSGLMTEADCYLATNRPSAPPRMSTSHVPAQIRQAFRDAQRAVEMRQYGRRILDTPWIRSTTPTFVWQHHDLFHVAGDRIAEHHDAPLIEFVHAPVVWEARRWGVRRPGWGAPLVHLGEARQIRRADLVACVSDEVATEVVRLGAAPHRVIVSPMGVDAERFSPSTDSAAWRDQFDGLGDFVFGWVGSFRRFHALDLGLVALAKLRTAGVRAGFVLVGDGQDRPRLEARVAELGLGDFVRFVGMVGNLDMPPLLGALDAAVITAAAGQDFHYSPLKLREYMAMGLAVIAPNLGEMARLLVNGETGLLYEPGDVDGLAEAVSLLAGDAELRRRIGQAGRDLILRTGTWDVIVNEALAQLSGAGGRRSR